MLVVMSLAVASTCFASKDMVMALEAPVLKVKAFVNYPRPMLSASRIIFNKLI